MVSPVELRELFEKRLAEGVSNPPGAFHPKDLERVKDDNYLSRMLDHCKNDIVAASKLLWTIMKWRKTVGASDITEDTINMDYVNQGILFPYGRDLDGCKLIIIKCKAYSRSQLDFEEVKKIFIYWLDRVEREEKGNKVTLFVDLDGASLSNFDIELIKYIINLFYYYPKFLNQIVIYQLPWILNAAFKIAKGVLPPQAVEIMKFSTKDTVLHQIISPEEALTSWGGKNNYEFTFVPEKRHNKRVSFAKIYEHQDSCSSTISTMSVEDPTIPTNSGGELLSIQPSDKIEFRNESEEMVGRIKITNLEENALVFKIRTTGPEKFWVRPSSGIISAKKTEQILITILPGYNKTAIRERFLVMATPIAKMNVDQKNLSEIWKNALQSEIEEHRLKCRIIDDTVASHTMVNNKVIDTAEVKSDLSAKALNDLRKDIESMRNELTKIKFYQYLSIVLVLVLMFLGFNI